MGFLLIGNIMWTGLINSNSIYMYIKNKKDSINKLNNIRKNSGISIFSVIKLVFVSIYTICKNKMVMKLQTWTDGLNIRKIDRDVHEITLFIGGKFVKMRIKIKRGPNVVLNALDDNSNDLTDYLESFYSYEMYHMTPKRMGVNSIEIVTSNGDTIKYNNEDKIL